MLDGIIVGLIVAGAVGYIIYRYAFKKSGGCGCGCECGSNVKGGSAKCCGDGSSSSSSSCGGRGE